MWKRKQTEQNRKPFTFQTPRVQGAIIFRCPAEDWDWKVADNQAYNIT